MNYSAHGKLLIRGEYLVMAGAKALALPLVKYKQTMEAEKSPTKTIGWSALDEKCQCWFKAILNLDDMQCAETSSPEIAHKLSKIFLYIKEKKPELLETGWFFQTKLTFSVEWGFGSSSTFISLISDWSGIDPFLIQKNFFGGSGFDIACAKAKQPIMYWLEDGKPNWISVPWEPAFKDKLLFLYSGNKKNTAEALKQNKSFNPSDVKCMSQLTESIIAANDYQSFQNLLREHEKLVSQILHIPSIKNQFPFFKGEMKNLGAWGGDFILLAPEYGEHFVPRPGQFIFSWSDLFE